MKEFDELVDIMRRLRSPDGCPWDREQTHASIAYNLIEEAFEAVEAIESGSDEKMREELGDVLLQVVFHAQMASERGAFDVRDVARGIVAKLVKRHPHVFGEERLETAEDVLRNWERLKSEERGAAGSGESADGADEEGGALAGFPFSMPAMLVALGLQKKAARLGYEFADDTDVLRKVAEEADELAVARAAGAGHDELAREVGDLLFSAVNVARFVGVNPERALREASRRFAERIQLADRLAREQGRHLADMTPAELDELWEEAKRRLGEDRRERGRPGGTTTLKGDGT